MKWISSDSEHLASLSHNVILLGSIEYLRSTDIGEKDEHKIVLKKIRIITFLNQLLVKRIIFPGAAQVVTACKELEERCVEREEEEDEQLNSSWIDLGNAVSSFIRTAAIRKIEGEERDGGKIEALKAEIETLTKAKDDAETKATTAENASERLLKEKETAEGEKTEAEEEIKKLKRQKEAMQKELEACKEQIAELQRALSTSEKREHDEVNTLSLLKPYFPKESFPYPSEETTISNNTIIHFPSYGAITISFGSPMTKVCFLLYLWRCHFLPFRSISLSLLHQSPPFSQSTFLIHSGCSQNVFSSLTSLHSFSFPLALSKWFLLELVWTPLTPSFLSIFVFLSSALSTHTHS